MKVFHMNKRLSLWFLVPLVPLILLGVYGKDLGLGKLFDPAGEPLNGNVMGKPWTYRSGWAYKEVGSETWHVTLEESEAPSDPCSNSSTLKVGYETYSVSFLVRDLRVGHLDFTHGSGTGVVSLAHVKREETGVDAKFNEVSGKGQITSLSQDSFRARLSIFENQENQLTGQFAVKLCR